ncbi:MAG: hypothetical protein ACI9S8_002580 [Chlamydiales bacterium]
MIKYIYLWAIKNCDDLERSSGIFYPHKPY